MTRANTAQNQAISCLRWWASGWSPQVVTIATCENQSAKELYMRPRADSSRQHKCFSSQLEHAYFPAWHHNTRLFYPLQVKYPHFTR